MKIIKKYMLLIFLIENLLVSSIFSGGMWPFYLIISLGVILLLQKDLWNRSSFKECMPLYLLGLVYIFYQFTFGIETLNFQHIIYLAARVVSFVIIIVSLVSNWNYYTYKVPIYLTVIILIVLFSGILETGDLNSGERMKLGFGNVNLTGSLAAICFAGILYFWNKKRSFLYIILAAISIYSLLGSGSRSAILYLAVMLFIWTRISLKKLLYAFFIVASILLIINMFSINLSGVGRTIGTIEGDVDLNRDTERQATLMMIAEKPLTGWGFEAENQGRAARISELGSHNGYLDTIKFMGYPCALIWFTILFFSVMPLLKYVRSNDPAIRYHLSIVLSTIATAFFEGWFTGVHQINSNIMFYSLAVLTIYAKRSVYVQLPLNNS